MLPAGIGIIAALAFVLGLIALAVWALKRFSGGALTGRSRLHVEVVQRLPLGPKSGLAIVRVGEKVLAVSVGDGGVHTLFEVDEADRQRIIAGSELATPMTSSAAAQSAFARGLSGVIAGPIQRAFGGGRVAASAMPTLRFDHTMTHAMREAMDTVSIARAVPVQAAPPRAAVVRDRDLRSVLAMTLAPSTRLLSIVAFAVVGLFGTADASLAQAATGTPVVTSTQPATIAPTVTGTQPATATATQPTTGAQPAPVTPAPSITSLPDLPALTLPGLQPPTGTATGQARPAGQPATNRSSTAQPEAPRARAANARPAANAAQPQPAQTADAATAGTAESSTPTSAADAVAGLVPQLDLRVGSGPDGGLRLNGTVGVVLMMGLMTLVPTLLLMMTGFTRILIVLHFLKQAMGTQSAPPAHLVAGLALLLTGFVMAPTLTEANRTAITPWLNGSIEQTEMLKEGVKPFREFMLNQTNEKDLRTFVEMSRIAQPDTPDDVPLHVLMSAFVASELRTAFQIGFAIYLPFIIIDAVVASVLMAMGMFMLPPAMISLPFKLLLFVLVDGWSLTMQSLIQSFR